MKSKDLKKILQYEANQIPIGQYQNEILSQVHQKDTNSSFLPTKKKTIGIWLSSSLAIVACVCIVAFAFIFNRDSKDKPHPFPTPQLSKAKQLLSYEMVALGNMVEVQDSTLQIKMKQDPTLEQQALVNEIHEYLITGEMMLNKEGLKIQNQANNDVEYANYAYKLVAQYQNSTDYILYYNEQTLWEEDKKEDIDEVSSHLEGILIKENIPFQVEGKKEVENDEYECELVIYEDQTRQNYIKINQETEINENEYEYEFYKNGECVKELSLEVETKNNRKEMSIEIQEGEIEKEFTFEYDLTQNQIHCTYENDVDDIEIKDIVISIYEEYYLYLFTKEDVEIQMPR